MNDEEIERWITVKGNHIPILKGESEDDAISRFFAKFDDTDDIDIDIELEDEDKKTKYETIYYKSDWMRGNKYISEEEVDKVRENGFEVHEMEITSEMKDLMDEYLKSQYIEDNNMRGLMNEFDRKIREIEFTTGSRSVLREYFRRKALVKCEEVADKFLKTLPKLENNSIEVCYRQANANGYVESQNYPYKSKESPF